MILEIYLYVVGAIVATLYLSEIGFYDRIKRNSFAVKIKFLSIVLFWPISFPLFFLLVFFDDFKERNHE